MKPCILELGNEKIEVGILPEVGGRVVYLRRPGGKNVLKSDPALWGKRSRRKISPTTVYVPYNGHEVWLGPQNEWWTHQNFRPVLKRKHAQWPPDPYLTMAPYAMLKHTPTEAVMQSPESPVTGMRFTIRVTINPDGTVAFSVTGKNVSRKAVSWDLWLNTRADGWAKCYVPADPENVLRVGGRIRPRLDIMRHTVEGGFFTFKTQAPSAGKRARWAKAFIQPARPAIYAFTGCDMLEITFKPHPATRMHPQQSLVEIYNATSVRDPSGLLELEYHGPYKTLNPGESMSAQEVWQVRKYNGPQSSAAHHRFIRSLKTA